MSAATGRWMLIVAGVAVAATVAAAIAVLGSPGMQRQLRQDERRVRDLSSLKGEIEEWGTERGALPADLAVLARRPGVRLTTADPFSAQPYAYQVLDVRNYRLCATFDTDTAEARNDRPTDRTWRHPRGNHCFDLALPPRKAD
jgi:hypothetical protein